MSTEIEGLLETLERTSALRILCRLRTGPIFITALKKSATNPDGLGSFKTLRKAFDGLLELGLVKEKKTGRPYSLEYSLTDKGRKVLSCLVQNLS